MLPPIQPRLATMSLPPTPLPPLRSRCALPTRVPDHEQLVVQHDHPPAPNVLVGSVDDGAVVDKRARRKEQCRVNQANYRKRKRQHEQQLGHAIETLEREIQALTTRRRALAETDPGPEHAIMAFYLAMQDGDPATDSRPTTAKPPRLSALQSEQFASLDELRHTWRGHQQSVACFRLHVLSTERLEAGEHAVIKATAELELSLDPDAGPLVCPVLQRFEIDSRTNRVAHVTSEVDLVTGVAAATAAKTQRTLHVVAHALEHFLRPSVLLVAEGK